jgi:hypothetical protein
MDKGGRKMGRMTEIAWEKIDEHLKKQHKKG